MNWLRRRVVLWLGQEVLAMEALKAASYTGALGVLRDLLDIADDKVLEGWSLLQFSDLISMNYYGGRKLLKAACDAHLKGPDHADH